VSQPRLLVPGRLAFLLRVERRVESRGAVLTHADIRALGKVWESYDPLAMRERARLAGFRLGRAVTVVRGVSRPYLVDRRAA
jgi:hypothetical protein